MKKLFTAILVFSLIITSVVSCNKAMSDKKNESITVNETKYSYIANEEAVYDKNKISCFSLLDSYKDGYIFTGMRYGADDEFKINTINALTSESEITDFQITDSETGISNIKKINNEIIALSLYNSVYSLCIFDEEGKEKGKLALDYYPGDIQINDHFIYLMDYENDKVKKYSDTLEFISEYNISSENYIPQFIRISNDGCIYCLLKQKASEHCKIVCVDKSGKNNMFEAEDMDEIIDFSPDSTGKLIVLGKEKGSDNKLLIDTVDTNGKICDMSEISECDTVYGITDSGTIIFSNSFGIWKHTEAGDNLLYRFDDDEIGIYSVNVAGEQVNIFFNKAVTCTDLVFVADDKGNIIDEYYTGYINDAVSYGEDIYYIYQDNKISGVRFIKDGKINDTGISFEDVLLNNIEVLNNGDIILDKIDLDGTESLISFGSNYHLISEKEIKSDLIDITSKDNIVYVFEKDKFYSLGSDLKNEYELPELIGIKNDFKCVKGNHNYDFVIESGDEIKGFSLDDKSEIVIANTNDFMFNDVSSLLLNNNDDIIINDSLGIYNLYHTEKNEAKDNSDLILKLACFNTDVELFNAVKEYNARNESHKVEIINYDNSEDENEVSQFDKDILSGKIPDIILPELYMTNTPAYIRNGLYMDLYEFMEKDPELNSETVNDNIIKAFDRNGNLYILPAFYRLDTIAVSCTNNNMKLPEFLESISTSDKPFIGQVWGQYLWNLIGLNLTDKSTNDKGVKLSEHDLKILIQFFYKYREQAENPDHELLSEYSDYIHWIDVEFGDPSSFYMNIGYDLGEDYDAGYTDSISGTVYTKVGFCISEKSEHKEQAWDFIKYIVNRNDLYNKTGVKYFNILKKNAVKPDPSEMPKNIIDKYNSIINGEWNNIYYDYDIIKIISDELYSEDYQSVEEKSERIMSALNKYYNEVR